jgi:hypothetical protein
MNDTAPYGKLASLKCLLISICALFTFGCGTTKWSDTTRTGTEQLLISNAIDRVIDKIDFSPMRNKKCYLNASAIQHTTDRDYLATTIRQQLATEGAFLAASEEEAEYIIEVRAGAVGTDRDELLVGIPATTIPAFPGSPYSATSIPEIPFIKRTKQRGVAKVALFAYNKRTGMPVWTSGNNQGESTARNLWFLGTGPLTRGTIYSEPTFAGSPLPIRILSDSDSYTDQSQVFPETFQGSPHLIPLNPFPPR